MQKLRSFNALRVGEHVRSRRQRWRIVDVRAFEACRLLTLRGTGVTNAGAEQRVLSPFDLVEPVARTPRLRPVGARRWRRRCRALLADARPAGALQTAHRARIDLLPHQLEPALAIVRGLGSRVLIADEVGLGKTIQAGLIVSELRALGAADRVLVVAPAGLREQWAVELSGRFGVDAALVDMREAKRRAATLPLGLNAWSTIPVAVTSIDYLKRPEVLPSILACRWDVVIVDEAHGVTPASDRHAAVSALSARAPSVVLLTATPHNGDRAAFESLCGLGAVDEPSSDRLLVFRRSRQEIALGCGRRVHRLTVQSTAAERRMHERLALFSRAVRAERGDDAGGVALALSVLHKRALSSARSLETSVIRRLSAAAAGFADRQTQLALPIDDIDGDGGGGELDGQDEAPVWNWPALQDADRERRMLVGIADAAHAAATHETKLTRLARLLERLDARRERAIVFTEYRDTLLHVKDALARRCAVAVAVIHGALAREERRAALDDFHSGRRTVLLATDAAGEGLNLHESCCVVINLELPWNPMRLEQRIGRVDRIGQTRRVHAFNLIAGDTGEARLFERLEARVALARRDIGAPNPLRSAARFDLVSELGAIEAGTPEFPAGFTGLVRLGEEAAVEHARLRLARVLTGDQAATDAAFVDPWLAFARTSARRARLPHLLALLESTYEDGCGRSVANFLAPLAVRFGSRIERGRAIAAATAIARSLEGAAPALLADAWAAWAEASVQHHERFWRTRLARERSIAEALAAAPRVQFQPGLFDRRADIERAATEEERAALISGAEERIAAAERAARCEATSARVALLLMA